MKSGYIIESRSILDSDIWNKPPLYFKVWHYLLLNAQHTEYKGLKRGQLYTSIPKIQEAMSYHVGFRKVIPSKSEIHRIIEWLRTPHERDYESDANRAMIITTKATHGMIITICNYNDYQDPKNYERNNEQNYESLANSTMNRDNINKNKNDKNNILSRLGTYIPTPRTQPRFVPKEDVKAEPMPAEMRRKIFGGKTDED